MNKKCIVSFIAGMAVMGAAFGGYSQAKHMKYASARMAGRYEVIEAKLNTIDQLIDKYYLNESEIDLDQLEQGIYSGYVDGLHENYTTYYTPEEYTDLKESTSGVYAGIGAYVSQDATTGVITIVKPFEGSPAEQAGIKKDDILYAVEGEPMTGVDLLSVISKLKGEAGTSVDVTVYRAETGQYIDLTIVRNMIDTPTVSGEMLDDHIGYIVISSFADVTADQFKKTIDSLESQGMEKVIFDLRDNGGGMLTSVCEILDRLLPEELLVYTEDKNGTQEKLYAENPDRLDMPMVVLVNGNTASASEIFTGALKDYGVATVIGTTTFGKGIVQSIIPLTDGSAVKITSSKYYTPSGVCIHGDGIEPNEVVEYDRNSESDNQLDAAVQFLENDEN